MSKSFELPRRRWGKSEISIPVIPFGTQGFGNHFGSVSDDEACELIRFAVDIGVNHFDTALCYGDSQRKLGLALKEGVIHREDIIISARVCCERRYEWDHLDYTQHNDVDYSAEYAIDNAERQLELLGTDYFDALMIHDPREVDPTIKKNGTLCGLLKLKDRGLSHNIGYAMNPHQFHLKAIETGELDVLLTFNDFNLFGQTATNKIIPLAERNDIGVLNGWSIKRGLLTGMDLSDRDPKDKEVQRATKMREWCLERETSLLAVALQFCMLDLRVHGNPIGSLNRQQLEANVNAVSMPLPNEVINDFLEQNF